jgi:thymidine kinase
MVQTQKSNRLGRLDLVIGCMFSGKTETLVDIARKTSSKYWIVKHSLDDRYLGTNYIVSHSNTTIPCHATANLISVLDLSAYREADLILIEEAQFFDDLVRFCAIAVEQDGKHIIAVGLDGDFNRKPFGQLLDLIPICDEIVKLRGKCQYCDNYSIFSKRIVNDSQLVLIGSGDVYAPVCRLHYLN